jgi:hypothetical protein
MSLEVVPPRQAPGPLEARAPSPLSPPSDSTESELEMRGHLRLVRRRALR